MDKVEKTEWHRVVAFGKQAEFCSNYLSKGRLVLIEGSIQTRKARTGTLRKSRPRRIQALDPKTQQKPVDDGWGKDLDDDYFSKKSDQSSSEHSLPKSKMDDDLGEQGSKRDPFDAPF